MSSISGKSYSGSEVIARELGLQPLHLDYSGGGHYDLGGFKDFDYEGVRYAPYILKEREVYKVYLDCSAGKVYCKHVFGMLLRPFHTLLKVSALPFRLIFEIYAALRTRTPFIEFAKRNLTFIMRTLRAPFFAAFIMVTHIAAIVLGG